MSQNISRRGFLISAVGGAAAAAFYSSVGFAARTLRSIQVQTAKLWTNWARNESVTVRQFYTPTSIEDLPGIIKQSIRVRAVGSGHSFNRIVPVKDAMICSENLKGIYFLSDASVVEVESGVTLNELNVALSAKGRALVSLGEIGDQTLAGMISTGTRGTGYQHASISDSRMLLGVQLITADGSTMNINDQENAEYLEAARMGLGSLGYIAKVRLATVPAFNLEVQNVLMPIEQVLKLREYKNYQYYSYHFYPHTDMAQVCYKTVTTQAPTKGVGWTEEKDFLLQSEASNLILDVSNIVPSKIPWVINEFVNALKNEDFVDYSYRAMVQKITLKHVEAQYMIQVENEAQMITAYRATVATFADKGTYYADLPIHVRYTRRDEGVLLSPTSGVSASQTMITINFNCHHEQLKKNPEGTMAFLQTIENEMIKLGARPHWGKIFFARPTKELGAQMDAFEMIRQKLDPSKKFLNEFVGKLLVGEGK